MHPSINTGLLRTLALDDLSSEFKSLQQQLPDDVITNQLLDAFERGSVSVPVFDVWFRVCKSTIVVQQALKQKVSVYVRYLGIRQLRTGLKSTQWESSWEAMGGTTGFLDILSDLSVREVKLACKAIGRCARGDGNVVKKRERVTELFKALHPGSFPEFEIRTDDRRPLTKLYQALVPSCTQDLVDWILSDEEAGKWPHVREKKLLETHSGSIEKAALRTIFEHPTTDTIGKARLDKLSTRYPSGSTAESGFSASMDFALRLLCNIIETKSEQVETEWVIDTLVRPLLRRAVRKHTSWPRTQKIVTTTLRFLEQYPHAGKLLTFDEGDVLHAVALCWSRRSALFQSSLQHLLQIVRDSNTSFEGLEDLLIKVPRSRRYALLRLSCMEVMGVDLDVEASLAKARGRLSFKLLSRLDASDALALFQCLRSARGDGDLVGRGPSRFVLAEERAPDSYEGDPDLYFLVLLNRNGRYQEAESYASKIMDIRKKKTQIASNRELRARLALSVWACANASGSLALLSETVQWAKGFIRDQLTASTIFGKYYNETPRLLSGFLVSEDPASRPQLLQKRVEQAHAILFDLLDVACEALREPHFQASDWHPTLELFTQVIRGRIELSTAAREGKTSSGDYTYDRLWEDTIAMLLRAERRLNDEENEKLCFGTLSGIIRWRSVIPDLSLDSCGRDVWRFLDKLAKARDELWIELRPGRCPDVLTLPEPFPRGLPVQNLLSIWDPFSEPAERRNSWGWCDVHNRTHYWSPAIASLSEVSPYVYSRVKQTLFLDPETALRSVPLEKTLYQAIGLFVDSYTYALRLYIPNICDGHEKQTRLKEVWDHATGPLSAQRMDSQEAFSYWKRCIPLYLQHVLGKVAPKNGKRSWPSLPKTDNALEPQEWNPLDGQPSGVSIPLRVLGAATYVDFTLGIQTKVAQVDTWREHSQLSPYIPSQDSPNVYIWDSALYEIGSKSHEAAVLAALLYLDAKYGSSPRLLASPFPSFNDIRYPCVYLDEEFLSSKELYVSSAAEFVGLGSVPLALVTKLAADVGAKARSQEESHSSHTLNNASFELIRALTESDRPGMAIDLVFKEITDHPETSSWARVLFSKGFLQRLPASNARECITMFAEFIGEKLDIQKLQRTAKSEASQDKKEGAVFTLTTDGNHTALLQRATVKVTTVKLLAQILHGSPYLSDDASLEILSSLVQKASHIDVHVSILKTLLSKLDTARPESWKSMIAALEIFVPLIGSLNEREPMSRDGLDRSESGEAHEEPVSLPSVQLTTDSGWEADSPMLDSVMSHFATLQNGHLLSLYLERILIPIINCLEKQVADWTTMFLKKYAPDDAEVLNTVIPPTPKGIYIVDVILSKSGAKSYRVPRVLLDKHVAFLAFKADPPAPISKLNEVLMKKVRWGSKPDVEVWLELYGQVERRRQQIWHRILPFGRIVGFDKAASETYVTPQAYQEAFLEVFRALLLADSPGYHRLSAFVSTVYESGVYTKPWWNVYGRTTVESITAIVQSSRTMDWERNPARVPAVLPDVFFWRLLLLSCPRKIWPDSVPDEDCERECKMFAQQLAAILDEISGSMYHEKLQQMKNFLESNQNALLTAVYLGDISNTRLSWLTTPEILRVDLAAYMILKTRGFEVTPLDDRLKTLLNSWITSENEEVRRTGYKVRALYFDASGKSLPDPRQWLEYW